MSAALKLIDSKNTMASILKGEGSYKSIGKPSGGFSASKR
jgi:hypothetical protein